MVANLASVCILSLLLCSAVFADNAYRDYYPTHAVSAYPAPIAETKSNNFKQALEAERANVLPLPLPSVTAQRNTAMQIEILSATKSQRIESTLSNEGESLLSVRVRITNVHSKGLVSKKALDGEKDATRGVVSPFGGPVKPTERVELDYTIKVPNIDQHFYMLADGIAHRLRPEVALLNTNTSLNSSIEIKQQGQSETLTLLFSVPNTATSLSLQYLDNSLGHISVPLSESTALLEEAGAFTCPMAVLKHPLADVCIHRIATLAQFEGYSPGPGKQLLGVNVSAQSFVTPGDKAAILQIRPNGYLWIKDSQNHFASARPVASGLLRFTPHVRSMETVVFEVAEQFEPHTLVLQINNDVIEASIGIGAEPNAIAPYAQFLDGDKVRVSLFGIAQRDDVLIADVGVQSLLTNKRIPLNSAGLHLVFGDNVVKPDARVSEQLAYGQQNKFIIPPEQSLRFDLAFKLTNQTLTEEPTAFQITGLDDSGQIDISTLNITIAEPVVLEMAANEPLIRTPELEKSDTGAKPIERVAKTDLMAGDIEPLDDRLRLQNMEQQLQPPEKIILQASKDVTLFEEIEPNDRTSNATDLLDPGTVFTVTGQHGPDTSKQRETDYYNFTISGTPQLWFFSLTGDAVSSMTIENTSRSVRFEVRKTRTSNTLVIPNALLASGQYTLRINTEKPKDSNNVTYELMATAYSSVSAQGETEPNNVASIAETLNVGDMRTGYLTDKIDKDLYAITIDGESEYIAFLIKPPPTAKLRLHVHERVSGGSDNQISTIDARSPGESLRGVLSLQPGTYIFTLAAVEPSDALAPYQILVNRVGRFEAIADLEPNNEVALANPLPDSPTFIGQLVGTRDIDWYRLPTGYTKLRIKTIADDKNKQKKRLTARLTDDAGKTISELKWDEDSASYVSDLENGAATHLKLSGVGTYEVTHSEDTTATQSSIALPVELAILDSDTDVASFIEYGQRISVPVRLRNYSGQTQQLAMKAHFNASRWRIAKQPNEISLQPNEVLESSILINVAPDAPSLANVVLDLEIVNDKGQSTATTSSLSSSCGVDPHSPFVYSAVPLPLLGGINVAWHELGAEIHALDKLPKNKRNNIGKKQSHLISSSRDVSQFWRVKFNKKNENESVTVKLAGKNMPLIVGSLFQNPINTSTSETPTDIEILLSTDDVTYQSIWRGSLPLAKQEHSVVFDKPTRARFAKMIVHAAGPNSSSATLARWKVIAEPGSMLGENAPLNLASPPLGGHLVSASNADLTAKMRGALEQPARSNIQFAKQAINEAHSWVVGFHKQRVAKLSSVRWAGYTDAKALKKAPMPRLIEVQASVDSPLGPWVDLGALVFNDETTALASIEFDEPAWARYIRFSLPALEEKNSWLLPKSLEVIEHPEQEQYRSILGEWGDSSDKSSYQWNSTEIKSKNIGTIPINTVKKTATELPQNALIQNQVLLGSYDNWYELDVAQGHNRVRFEVTGEPTLSMQFTLTDASSNPITLKESALANAKLELSAEVAPGRYYLHVVEPPRSIVITWDTSSSVGAYLPTIQEAMFEFIKQVQPNLEFVNLLPFSIQPKLLLAEFSDNAAVLNMALVEQPAKLNSSDAESNLLAATTSLDSRKGTRAILMLTDADSGSNARDTAELWDALNDVKPRIFTLEIHRGANAAHQQDKMQNWAAVRNGFYSKFHTDQELRQGFARASCHLRRPARYSISSSVSYDAPAEPGGIQLTASTEKTALSSSDALEIILDASGSMHKKIGNSTRLKIAQDMLIDLVTNVIPENKPVALRIFGHKEERTCRTDLAIPLAPSNARRLAKVIKNVNAQAYAKTPLADSLALVADDLKLATGAKNVILVTDGEESCNGDPEGEIKKIRDSGIDVRVNIVGFAIDDISLKKNFAEWAKLGGGQYFDAPDAAALKSGLQQALQYPFDVVNDKGVVIANGIVGGAAVSVPNGAYSVNVQSIPAIRLESVIVESGKITNLAID